VFSNHVFCIVFVFIAVAQVIIVEFGGDALKVTRGGLHGYHWLIAVILGMSTWVASFLFKLLPDSMFPLFGTKTNQTEDEGSA
jgi:P-type Ca2+ transporter type 2C